ncbi:hypothetical protein M9Y10_029653 [Tritrichomonas musculus]|uniref:DUF3447 domain-containing protein n=1 Tax=Tritrichomonas musculus TaxID=1915356 RepID=A0ABR2KNM9_9EUKA
MSVAAYLEVLKSIQSNILQFIDMEDNSEENYQNIITILEDQKIHEKEHEIKLIIHLISKISVNHHRYPNFFSKIEKLLLYFKKEFQKNYTNDEIFELFEFDIRIILFLLKEKILIFTKTVYSKLNTYFNLNYFYPEIKAYEESHQSDLQKEKKERNNIPKKEKESELFENNSDTESSDNFFSQEESYDLNDEIEDEDEDEGNCESHFVPNGNDNKSESIERMNNFYRSFFGRQEQVETPEINEDKRLIGENDSELCEIIRKDLIEEFIIYVNKKELKADSKIEKSMYETNYFLRDSYNLTLVKYAAFFGSIQIFKYLYNNGAKLDKKMWIFAIHGENEEIIHILEEQGIKPEKGFIIECYEESMKCHHNGIALYIEKNYLLDEYKDYYNVRFNCYMHYNFEFIHDQYDHETMYPMIYFDYYTLIKTHLENAKIDINKKIEIQNNEFQYKHKETFIISLFSAPLIIAIETKSLDIVKLILNHHDIDVNLNKIEYNHMYLNNKKLDYDFIKEKSPLLIALQMKNMEMIKLLLSSPKIDVNKKYIKKKITGTVNNENRIDYDDENNKIDIVKELSLLNIGISQKNYEFVELLLSNPDIDVNSEEIISPSSDYMIKYTPLMKAIQQLETKIALLLLSNSKIDVNCKMTKIKDNELITEKTALYAAIELNIPEIIQTLLLNKDIEVNTIVTKRTYNMDITSKRTALYKAVKCNNVEAIKLLLEKDDIDVNIKTINKQEDNDLLSEKTALYIAVKKNRVEIVKLLLSNENIDVNIETIKSMEKDKFVSKKSILYRAVENQNIEIIELLLSNQNIDVNYKSLRINVNPRFGCKKAEKTILSRAVETNNINIVKLLLSMLNIDINQKSFKYVTLISDEYGEYVRFYTPLHVAILEKNIEIIKILINNEKIDKNAKDEHGKSPFELTNDEKILKLIEEH